MNNYKKMFFVLIESLILILCVIHTHILYSNMANNQYSAVPAGYAFLIIIPYVVVSGVCLLVYCKVRKRK